MRPFRIAIPVAMVLAALTSGVMPATYAASGPSLTLHFTNIDDPSAGKGADVGTYAHGINAQGDIVGEYIGTSGLHGFLLHGGVYTNLDDPNGVGITGATGINRQGDIVGYYYGSAGNLHGFFLHAGVYTTLDDPNAGTGSSQGTQAEGINSQGQISGYYLDSANVTHGFLLQQGHYTTIDEPNAGIGPNQGTYVYDNNKNGDVVGFYNASNNNSYGYLLHQGQFTTLVPPAGYIAIDPYGINDSGNMVGDVADSAGCQDGFYMDQIRTVVFSDPSAQCPGGTSAYGINGSRNVVGFYPDSASNYHSYLLTHS